MIFPASLSLGTSSAGPLSAALAPPPRHKRLPKIFMCAQISGLGAQLDRGHRARVRRGPINIAEATWPNRVPITIGRMGEREGGRNEKSKGKREKPSFQERVPRAFCAITLGESVRAEFPRISGITPPREINRACPRVRACVPVYVSARGGARSAEEGRERKSGCFFEWRNFTRIPASIASTGGTGSARCNASVPPEAASSEASVCVHGCAG